MPRSRPVHAAGGRAAPERPGGEVPALLWPVARVSRSRSAARVWPPRPRRSIATTSSGTSSSLERACSRRACPARSEAGSSCWSSSGLAARGRARVRDRLRGRGVPVRGRDPRHDRAHRGAVARVARHTRPVFAAARGGRALPNPALAATYRRILDEARGGSREEEIEKARRAYYEGFVAEEIDRFVAAEGGLLDRRRHGALARVARAGRVARVRRPDRVQDAARGRPAPPGCSSLPCSTASTWPSSRRRSSCTSSPSARSSPSPTVTPSTETRGPARDAPLARVQREAPRAGR